MTTELKQVADQITANTIFCTKEVLTADEAAKYMGVSKSYLYKLTCKQEIPHYKPNGKLIYFDRQDVEGWMKQNRVISTVEAEQKASKYLMQKGGKV